LLQGQVGLGDVHLGLTGRHFFGARLGLNLCQLGASGAQIGLVVFESRQELPVIDQEERIPLLNRLTDLLDWYINLLDDSGKGGANGDILGPRLDNAGAADTATESSSRRLDGRRGRGQTLRGPDYVEYRQGQHTGGKQRQHKLGESRHSKPP